MSGCEETEVVAVVVVVVGDHTLKVDEGNMRDVMSRLKRKEGVILNDVTKTVKELINHQFLMKQQSPGPNLIKLLGAYLDAWLSQVRRLNKRLKAWAFATS